MDFLIISALGLPFLKNWRKLATTFAFFIAIGLSIYHNYLIATFFYILSLIVIWLSKWSQVKYPLFFLAMFDLIGLLKSQNFLELFIYFELAIYASYFLFAKEENFKAVFRYFVVNSIGSAFMLFAIALSFFNTGSLTHITTNALMFFAIGLLIKLGIVSFQDWLVEIYKKSTLSSIIFFSAILTAVSPLALLFVIKTPSLPLQFFALFSMLIANLMALKENSLKRLLALFDASNLAFVLLAIAVSTEASRSAALFMMLSHVIAISFSFTALAISKSTKIQNLKVPEGMELPFYISMFTLSGLPPFHLFPAKLLLFSSIFAASRNISYILLINLAMGVISTIRLLSSVTGTIKVKIPKKFKILLIAFTIVSLILGIYPNLFAKLVESQMFLFIK